MTDILKNQRILLIIGGGIAAYKSLDLIRRLRDGGAVVIPVLTRAGAQFVTPLSVSALAEAEVFTDLFDLTREARMGHIELSRSADLIVIAPASADLMAKMAHGMADDLATTLLLARDKPAILVPSMNVRMWHHPATQRNLQTLLNDGVRVCGPMEGTMACGEFGMGRMAEVDMILQNITESLADTPASMPLNGRHIIVTSGPTHEPIDPVRYIGNRSSGQQGAAIATALVHLGAKVTFITGPVAGAMPTGCLTIPVQTAEDMERAVMSALPAEVAIFAAAVADWRVRNPAVQKMKKKIKKTGDTGATLDLIQNPDILAQVAQHKTHRPKLVIGFAAETDSVIKNARAKYKTKGCDWLIANDVSEPETMGGATNRVVVIRGGGEKDIEPWARMSKTALGQKLAQAIGDFLGDLPNE